MDSKTTIQELKLIVQNFCEERDWSKFHNPKDLAIGISIEANELLEHFRFKTKEQMDELFKNPQTREEISDELADIFYFILRFAQMNEIDIASSFYNKHKKNGLKYSVEKSKGTNKKYSEL